MQRLATLFVFFCICLHLTATAEIIEAHDLDQAIEHFDRLNTNSLLLWDVDLTLILPVDRIMHPNSSFERKELKKTYFSDISEDEHDWLISQMFNSCTYGLVDEKLPDFIATIQDKKIPSIALTAISTGPFGSISSMEEWRFNQLKELGIDFSNAFPDHPRVDWHEESEDFMRFPVFFQGILCTDGIPKGFVLEAFLSYLEWTPDFVLFIDDKYSFLQSVEEVLEEMGIPFLGIHYHAAQSLTTTVDWDIAHLQYKVLLDEGVWLNDEIAQEQLLENSSLKTEEMLLKK